MKANWETPIKKKRSGEERRGEERLHNGGISFSTENIFNSFIFREMKDFPANTPVEMFFSFFVERFR